MNPLFEEYNIVLDYCKMFLSNCEVNNYSDDISIFSFLVNTESLFEDFIYGFIDRHKSSLHIKSIRKQVHGHLGTERDKITENFGVKLDYLIKMEDGREFIADAKYKQIYRENKADEKNYGISNGDIFQMISYSYRKNIDKVILLYPAFASENGTTIHHKFDLLDASDKPNIKLDAKTLNVIHDDCKAFNSDISINSLFEKTENNIKEDLKSLFDSF